MSIRVMKSVWDFKLPDSIPTRQQHAAKLILLKLADNASDDGRAWPSIQRIAHECSCSYRTVSRMLKQLEDASIIRRDGRTVDGMKSSSVYWINVNKLNDEADPYKVPAKETENPFNASPVSTDRTSSASNWSTSPINRQEPSIKKNTDFFSKKEAFVIQELFKEAFPNCYEIMASLEGINKRLGTESYYTGKLSLDEWQECEQLMDSCYEFQHDAFANWWHENKRKAIKKKPSLPNIICHMKNADFDKFYEMNFQQD